MQLEGLKQERTRLQHILENQKFTPADIERINRERNELQQTIHSLNQSLEEVEQLVWNEEVNLSKTKEKVRDLQMSQPVDLKLHTVYSFHNLCKYCLSDHLKINKVLYSTNVCSTIEIWT